MTLEHIEERAICRRVNIHFRKTIINPPEKTIYTCFVCKRVSIPVTNRWTTIWEAARCWAGHGQGERGPRGLAGLCRSCDVKFIHDTAKGRRLCTRGLCRRTVYLNEGALCNRLGGSRLLRYGAPLHSWKLKLKEC